VRSRWRRYTENVKRGAQIAAVSACGLTGLFCAVVLAVAPAADADEGTTGATTASPATTTSTTPTVPTIGTTTTTTPTAPPPLLNQPKVIVAGVTVGGTLVGGLTGYEARELVRQRFSKPITLVVAPGAKHVATPQELGAASHLTEAIKLAVRVRRAGFVVPLKVDVPRAKVERLVARLAKRYHREPVDARLKLRNLRPFVTEDHPGRRLQEVIAAREIVRALKTHDRMPLELPFDEIKPEVTTADLGEAIVIRRDSKRLLLYRIARAPKLIRTFHIATGRSDYPTPIGKFEIINKQADPWWYPPTTSAWAEGKEPVPPGPGNPLGTRWMGISSPYVGIHGTPVAASIGYSASHGCIRMLIPQVEWLFTKVDVGTPVFIVSA
jgi:lipoprotein-anchoring transpeptidase ErfK/SrfK